MSTIPLSEDDAKVLVRKMSETKLAKARQELVRVSNDFDTRTVSLSWQCKCDALIAAAKEAGDVEATIRWAHWKDGIQYVGSCGTTLAEALANLRSGRKP